MGASTPETDAKMLFQERRMVKEGRDVKFLFSKSFSNSLSAHERGRFRIAFERESAALMHFIGAAIPAH
jgi:hypothetical protein